MNWKPMSYTELNKVYPRNKMCKIQKIIMAFMESEAECAELTLEVGEYANTNSCTGVVRKAIKALNVACKCEVHNKRVFLIKTIT